MSWDHQTVPTATATSSGSLLVGVGRGRAGQSSACHSKAQHGTAQHSTAQLRSFRGLGNIIYYNRLYFASLCNSIVQPSIV